jgi:hypothetical protein
LPDTQNKWGLPFTSKESEGDCASAQIGEMISYNISFLSLQGAKEMLIKLKKIGGDLVVSKCWTVTRK